MTPAIPFAIAIVIASAVACSNADSTEVAAPAETRQVASPLPTRAVPPILVLTHQAEGAISILDTARQEVVATHRIGGPIAAAALSADGQRIFASVAGSITTITLADGKVLSSHPLRGEHSALVPAGDLLYVIENTSDKGRVTAIDLRDGRVRAERVIDHLAGTGTLSSDGQRLFVPHSFYTGRVTVLDTPALEIKATITVEDGAVRPRLSWDDRYLYVPNGNTFDGRITVVDTTTHRRTVEIPVEGEPTDLAITPDGRLAYAPLFRQEAIVEIDLVGHKVIRTIPVREYPDRVALDPGGTVAFVLHNKSTDMSVIDLKTRSVAIRRLALEPFDILAPGRARPR